MVQYFFKFRGYNKQYVGNMKISPQKYVVWC